MNWVANVFLQIFNNLNGKKHVSQCFYRFNIENNIYNFEASLSNIEDILHNFLSLFLCCKSHLIIRVKAIEQEPYFIRLKTHSKLKETNTSRQG